jgi:cytochrome bd-type quinol oxidase subunit 2
LIVLGFIADIFKKDIGVPASSTAVLNIQPMMTALFLVIIIGLLSLFMYFQTKKSDTFLKHRLWDKMYIVMPVIVFISLVIVMILFLTGPLSEVTQSNRWLIYAVMYYMLFVINMTVLAVIHKVKKNTISNEHKISYSFVITSLGLLLVIFIL